MRTLPLFCTIFVLFSFLVLVIESKSSEQRHHRHHHRHRHTAKAKGKLKSTQVRVFHSRLRHRHQYLQNSQPHHTRFIRSHKTQIIHTATAQLHISRKIPLQAMGNTRIRRQIPVLVNSSDLKSNNSLISDNNDDNIQNSSSFHVYGDEENSTLGTENEPSDSSSSPLLNSSTSTEESAQDTDEESSDDEEKEPSESSPSPSLQSNNNEESGQDANENEENTDEEESELHTYRDARKNDPAHYYRMPGELCFTNDKIAKEISRLNATGNITNLQRHKIDRQRCFFYEYIYCAPVSRKKEKGEKEGKIETRCICIEGRTWSEGACFAYHNQPCRWSSDCVTNSRCMFEVDLEEERQKKEEREADKRQKELYYDEDKEDKEEEEEEEDEEEYDDENYEYPIIETSTTVNQLELEDAEDKNEKLKFDLGICKCTEFTKCSRKVEYPNFIESTSRKKHPLTALQFVGITFFVLNIITMDD